MSSDRLSGFSSAFDELLERSRRELDALSSGSGSPALTPAPGTAARPSASPPSVSRTESIPPATPAASRSPAEHALDEKLGAGWRYEVLDRTRDGDELVVRCRVTAPARGVSRTWYGSAPMAGTGRSSSGLKGSAGNVKFTLGRSPGKGAENPIQAERDAERSAVESALAACARLL